MTDTDIARAKEIWACIVPLLETTDEYIAIDPASGDWLTASTLTELLIAAERRFGSEVYFSRIDKPYVFSVR